MNTSDEEKKLFERELEKLKMINSKKDFNRSFIVDYFGTFQDLSTHYILMEYYKVC